MKKIILLPLLILAGIVSLNATEPEIRIVPYPQHVTVNDGYFTTKSSLKVAAAPDFNKEAEYFISQIQKDTPFRAKQASFRKADISIVRATGSLAHKEGAYLLKVDGNSIRIEANDRAGAFYGIQSLLQLIRSNDGRIQIRQCEINDYPTLAWRSFMLDEGRYFKGKEVVRHILDEMASMKMNIFQWHLTDDQGWRIEIRKYPRLTEIGSVRDSSQIGWYEYDTYDGKRHGGYYTQEDIKEIVEYAAERHITIVPEIEMPGHSAAAIAAYPWLSAADKEIKVPCRFGVLYNIFNVADEKVLTFLTDVLDEVMSLFPSKVIHIGGDEVRYDEWNASPQVQEFIRDNNLGGGPGLQVWFTNRMAEYIESKGRDMMGWNDITGEQLHHFQTGSGKLQVDLSPNAIVQFWKGDFEMMARTAKRGNRIINSYNNYTYLNYSYEYDPVQATYEFEPISLEKAYNFAPVPDTFPADLKEKIIGSGCQMWGEWIPTVEDMNYLLYPRIAAYAETFWLPAGKKDFGRFSNILEDKMSRWKKSGIIYGKSNPVEQHKL